MGDQNKSQRVPRSNIPKSNLAASPILDLIDALTIVAHVSSPVGRSELPMFRRKLSSVYDALVHSENQDPDWETIAGYEVHAVDA